MAYDSPPTMEDREVSEEWRQIYAIVVQLTVTLGVAALSFFIFCLLRRRFPVLYAPKSLNPEMRRHLLPLPDSLFGWVSGVWGMEEERILRSAGFDALVYIKFWKMGFRIFLWMSITAIALLLPAHIWAHPDPSPTIPNPPPRSPPPLFLDHLPRHSPMLYAHFLCTYIFTIIVCLHVYEFYKWFVHERFRFLLYMYPGGHNKAVLVTGIPAGARDEKKLKKRYADLRIGDVDKALIVPETTYLQRCINTRQEALTRLERACARWAGRRRMRARVMGEDAPLLGGEDPTRPVRTLGPSGWSWVDEVGIAAEAFKEADSRVRGIRKQTFARTGTGFVMFSREASANAASQTLLVREPLQYITRMAPEKDDIYWPNVNAPVIDTTARRWTIKALVCVLVLSWAIPVGFVSSISSLKLLAEYFPSIEWVLDLNPALTGLVEGLLPTVAVSTLMALVPSLFRTLSQWQGHRTWSGIDAATFGKMYFFQYVNIILVYTISRAIIEVLFKIIETPTSIPYLLGGSLPRMSPFFLNFVLLQGFITIPVIQLLRIVEAGDQGWRIFHALTPRERADSRRPDAAAYGHLYTLPVLIFTIGLTYSVMAPPILLAALGGFSLGRITATYNMTRVYARRGESGGRMWEEVFLRLLWSVLLFQLSTAGVLGLRGSRNLGLAVLPTSLLTLLFWRYCSGIYGRRAKNLPLHDIARGEEEAMEGIADGGGLAPTASSTSAAIPPANVPNRLIRTVRSWARLDEGIEGESAAREGPMTSVHGVLDGSVEGFEHPAVYGTLPELWVEPTMSREIRNLLR